MDGKIAEKRYDRKYIELELIEMKIKVWNKKWKGFQMTEKQRMWVCETLERIKLSGLNSGQRGWRFLQSMLR